MTFKLNGMEAFILVGGKSRRFGEPKCLAKVNNKSLTDIVYKNLNDSFEKVSIIGKKNHFSDYPFIKDIHSVQCPMNGIATALENSGADWVFILACDMPKVKVSVINELYSKIDFDKQAAIPILNDKLQPLCGFYNKSLLVELNKSIVKKEYSIFKILNQLEIEKITISQKYEKQLLNINYPTDIELINDDKL